MASLGIPHTSCCHSISRRKVQSSLENGRLQCSSSSAKIAIGMRRSSWLGECQVLLKRRRRCRGGGHKKYCGLEVRAGVEDLLHNQVLVSCTVASVLGQLAKPFTYALFGKGFNWRLILTPGGMPSTHSASVTAAATTLGMERGLSDSFFGLSVLFASIVMYDAQGVRRSVGKQAKVINTIVFTHFAESVPQSGLHTLNPTPDPSSYAIGVELARGPAQAELAFMEKVNASTSQASKRPALLDQESSLEQNGTPSLSPSLAEEKPKLNRAIAKAKILLKGAEELPSVKGGEVSVQEFGNPDGWRHIPLKESVGHTKVEVFVGAMWGIAVALALHLI